MEKLSLAAAAMPNVKMHNTTANRNIKIRFIDYLACLAYYGIYFI